ncbi:hypothetical protein Anapl_03021 [Anas platyrhynchos]|uniref:Uncharacterized protein n=1 Tax=Anas platyrhynchos TaxID=8839 RepID=R0JLT9_ANAPL|nr:hypothetical protein Anapl_03021 [Anas platyrhynchos]
MVTFDQSTDESWGERLLPHQQGSRYHDSQQLQHGCRRCRWVVSASSRSGSTQGAAQDHAGLPLGLLIMEPSRSHSSAVPGASPACSHPHAAPRSCLFTCCVSPLRLSPAAQERSDEHVLTQSALLLDRNLTLSPRCDRVIEEENFLSQDRLPASYTPGPGSPAAASDVLSRRESNNPKTIFRAQFCRFIVFSVQQAVVFKAKYNLTPGEKLDTKQQKPLTGAKASKGLGTGSA